MSKGSFIAFEGADGVGKSTIMRLAVPELVRQGDFSGYTFFHWKPVPGGVHEDAIPEGDPHDPRESGPRSFPASLVFLAYHWLTFWRGYHAFVRPALRRGRLVVADRYTYDVLLDPARFRLRLPRWILRVFVRTLPRPDRVYALTAPPDIIRKRKPELAEDEIRRYQDILLFESSISNRYVIDATPTPPDIVRALLRNSLQ